MHAALEPVGSTDYVRTVNSIVPGLFKPILEIKNIHLATPAACCGTFVTHP